MGPTATAAPSRDTAPPQEGERAIRFVCFGDVEDGLPGLRALLARLRGERLDFGVLLGDTVRRPSHARYRLLGRVLAAACPSFPLHFVPGNRDGAGTPDLFAEHLGARVWTFRGGDVVFAGLDNAAGRLSAESLRVAESAAETAAGIRAAGRASRLVVFAHRPFHARDARGRDAGTRRGDLADLRHATSAHAPDLVVAGHLDLWQQTTDPFGTLHVTNGHVRPDDDARGPEVPTAAVITVDSRGISVERVQATAAAPLTERLRLFAAGPVAERAEALGARVRRFMLRSRAAGI